MNIVYERCAGLDVHKRSVTACACTPDAKGHRHKERETFSTMTSDVLRLRQWLTERKVTHVALESTGVYWQPIYGLLEGHFELLLVNAQHIKAVPGRKTDVRDAEWLADLLQHGLLRASFVPPISQRHVRELTRYRTSLSEERSRAVNRLQKILEGANIKLASVASDLMGVSARAMLEALLQGEADPNALAQLARGRMRSKRDLLAQALQGRFTAHHRFLIREQLAHIDGLDEHIAELSKEIAERLRPFEAQLKRLETIPGIKRRLAEVILAEIGADMTRFPSARHLASWAGVCPGNNESAGKRLSGKTRKGSRLYAHCPGRSCACRHPYSRTATSLLSIIAWSFDEAARRRRLPLDIHCSSLSTMFSLTRRTMRSWEATTSTSGIGKPSRSGWCGV